MSSFVIKLLALLTMLIDHVGATLVPYGTTMWWTFRIIGRLAFPIFCFCVAEGMRHTRSRGKYLLRLLIFALISEIPFDLAFHGALWSFEGQNVMFTFLFAVAGITVFEQPKLLAKFERSTEKSSDTYAYAGAEEVIKTFALAACAGLAYVLDTDYGLFGVLLVYAFYFGAKVSKLFSYICAAVTIAAMSAFYYYTPGFGINWQFFGLQCCAAAALLPIALYNGKRGPKMKWLFYVFYPAHLTVLYFVMRFGINLT